MQVWGAAVAAKQSVLAIMPPQPPTNPADAAMPEQEVPPAGKRIGVEEATAAILSNMKKKGAQKEIACPRNRSEPQEKEES